MDKLTNRHCVPCEKKTPPLGDKTIKELGRELKQPWQIATTTGGIKKLAYEFSFTNFPEAVAFVNKIVPVAEAKDHHPDLHIFYNRVRIELYTHSIGDLSENDFILAAKIEELI